MPLVLFNPLDRVLSGAIIPGQSGPRSDGNEGVLHMGPKASALLEPHHQIVLCHIRTLVRGGLTPLQRCSRCILQPQLTGQYIYLYIYIYILRERERESS